MVFRSSNSRFVAGFMSMGFMLIVAGCQSSDGGSSGGGFMGMGKKDDAAINAEVAKVKASDLRAFCPKVTLREGTAFYSTYAKAGAKPKAKKGQDAAAVDTSNAPQDDSSRVVYQASIGEVTRDCTRNNGMLNMKIAVAGRVVPGPMVTPGTITMPIRIAVVEGDKVLYSQIYQHKVQISDTSSATQFVLNDSNISIPEPTANTYQAFAGFDEGVTKKVEKPSEQKPVKRRVHKPKPKAAPVATAPAAPAQGSQTTISDIPR
ncbi:MULTISPECIES: hypothetical protein [Phyllobacteriaceae]|jgi:hypothetical protein|uniref:Lipoprotein n=1 Tax=Mesorhizobium hungaricum TaxID=1566387 RepID=A0A1C2DJC3_9HYPH|nr:MULTISPECIES: hypothetical protein [Mesorhizobium]MBN9233263.1 hypothetical protein [Mesorhizobium sp.]MDQ0332048.1 hypothetical protein [Mesorhizobium sp. YL-MeA3-2017]OCX14862.1 hypothetical protein QV13_20865 [Mesorhizobium hungaricum]